MAYSAAAQVEHMLTLPEKFADQRALDPVVKVAKSAEFRVQKFKNTNEPVKPDDVRRVADTLWLIAPAAIVLLVSRLPSSAHHALPRLCQLRQ